MDDLFKLAQLIKIRNQTEIDITNLIGRPAQIGHIGEFIASKIFDIRLQESASYKGIDGYFASGNLVNRSVNIKWYAKLERILDLNLNALPDSYLVLSGPLSTSMSSRRETRPWLINSVFLFDAKELVDQLVPRKTKLGTATSINSKSWKDAEIYPHHSNQRLILTAEQREQLSWFQQ
jgi:hypothetical protein